MSRAMLSGAQLYDAVAPLITTESFQQTFSMTEVFMPGIALSKVQLSKEIKPVILAFTIDLAEGILGTANNLSSLALYLWFL